MAFFISSIEMSSCICIIPSYSLSSPRKNPVNLHALPKAIGRTPVTIGSKVPKWLVFFKFNNFLT
jgi:hypothetical protein